MELPAPPVTPPTKPTTPPAKLDMPTEPLAPVSHELSISGKRGVAGSKPGQGQKPPNVSASSETSIKDGDTSESVDGESNKQGRSKPKSDMMSTYSEAEQSAVSDVSALKTLPITIRNNEGLKTVLHFLLISWRRRNVNTWMDSSVAYCILLLLGLIHTLNRNTTNVWSTCTALLHCTRKCPQLKI